MRGREEEGERGRGKRWEVDNHIAQTLDLTLPLGELRAATDHSEVTASKDKARDVSARSTVHCASRIDRRDARNGSLHPE